MITQFLRGLKVRENQKAFVVGGGVGLAFLCVFTAIAHWPH